MLAKKTLAFLRNYGGGCRQNPFLSLTYRALVKLFYLCKCRSGLKYFTTGNNKSFPAFHEGYSRISTSEAEKHSPKYKELIQENHRIPNDINNMKSRDRIFRVAKRKNLLGNKHWIQNHRAVILNLLEKSVRPWLVTGTDKAPFIFK